MTALLRGPHGVQQGEVQTLVGRCKRGGPGRAYMPGPALALDLGQAAARKSPPEQEELRHKQLADGGVDAAVRHAGDAHAAEHLWGGGGGGGEGGEAAAAWRRSLLDLQRWCACRQRARSQIMGGAAVTTPAPCIWPSSVGLTCSSGLHDSKNTSMAIPNSASLLQYTPAPGAVPGSVCTGRRQPGLAEADSQGTRPNGRWSSRQGRQADMPRGSRAERGERRRRAGGRRPTDDAAGDAHEVVRQHDGAAAQAEAGQGVGGVVD